MFELKINFETLEEFLEFTKKLQWLETNYPARVVITGKKTSVVPTRTTVTAAVPIKHAIAPSELEEPEGPSVSQEELKRIAVLLVDSSLGNELSKLLDEFKLPNLSRLDKANYDVFYKRLKIICKENSLEIGRA
jgi:hypothetical protein